MSYKGKRTVKVLRPDCERGDIGQKVGIYMKVDEQSVEDGFRLEELISEAISKIPGIDKNLRESEIKAHFQDSSLNGVDHWIQVGRNHVLIQDKWKDTTGQQEVSQFLQCAERLNRRLPRDDNIYLLWVSKIGPTQNSYSALLERGAEVICCSMSVEALVKLAIIRIAECLQVDAVPALMSIPKNSPVAPIERGSTIVDEEAMEILRIRRELNEKKRLEEEERKANILKEQEDKLRIQELLKTDNAFAYRVGLRNGHGDLCPWVWNPELSNHLSVKAMLEAYEEVETYRKSCIPRIQGAVQKAMDMLWEDTTDERIFQREAIQNTGGCGWSQPDIQYFLGTKHKPFTDNDYWQAIILNELAPEYLNAEYQKWYYYCQKFLERNKGKPMLHEALKKAEDLEKEVIILKQRNEVLEGKLEAVRRVALN